MSIELAEKLGPVIVACDEELASFGDIRRMMKLGISRLQAIFWKDTISKCRQRMFMYNGRRLRFNFSHDGKRETYTFPYWTTSGTTSKFIDERRRMMRRWLNNLNSIARAASEMLHFYHQINIQPLLMFRENEQLVGHIFRMRQICKEIMDINEMLFLEVGNAAPAAGVTKLYPKNSPFIKTKL